MNAASLAIYTFSSKMHNITAGIFSYLATGHPKEQKLEMLNKIKVKLNDFFYQLYPESYRAAQKAHDYTKRAIAQAAVDQKKSDDFNSSNFVPNKDEFPYIFSDIKDKNGHNIGSAQQTSEYADFLLKKIKQDTNNLILRENQKAVLKDVYKNLENAKFLSDLSIHLANAMRNIKNQEEIFDNILSDV